VTWQDGAPVSSDSLYRPEERLLYHREVEHETVIPFQEEVLFHDDHLLVACKPHFLPVTPGGRFVDQCLLHRLRKSTGNDDLVPLHRIDRETSGLVLFSTNPESRTRYCELFSKGQVRKVYHAVSAGEGGRGDGPWLVEDRIVSGEPWFRMCTVSGIPNARSHITLVERRGGLSRFELAPITGKTHQLRLHLSGLGFAILNDHLYPTLQPETPDDYARPLQLVAKFLEFVDPLTGAARSFESPRAVVW
jgi:tRNA pseudouridine32 synthase / 23S rRNA pseudouridine746 synthase